jgi:hypothetical protein
MRAQRTEPERDRGSSRVAERESAASDGCGVGPHMVALLLHTTLCAAALHAAALRASAVPSLASPIGPLRVRSSPIRFRFEEGESNGEYQKSKPRKESRKGKKQIVPIDLQVLQNQLAARTGLNLSYIPQPL